MPGVSRSKRINVMNVYRIVYAESLETWINGYPHLYTHTETNGLRELEI